MTIWISITAIAVAAVTYGVCASIQSEAAKETARINAEAQKYTADQARISQVAVSQNVKEGEIFGFKTDKAIEDRIMAQEDKEFEQNLEQDKEIALAQNALFEVQYSPDTSFEQPQGAQEEFGYDHGYDAEGDPMLS